MNEKNLNKILVQGVIFDLDGTLIDYEGVSNEAISHPFEKFGHSITFEEQSRIIGTNINSWAREFIKEKGLTDILIFEDYYKQYFDYIANNYHRMLPMKGAVDIINKFYDLGIPMAIATSTPKEKYQEKIKFFPELIEKISIVVTGSEVVNGKPSPDIFLLAAEKLGKDPKKCLVFEDAPSGVQGAMNAGCYTIAIPDYRMIQWTKEKFTSLIPNEIIECLSDFNTDNIIKI